MVKAGFKLKSTKRARKFIKDKAIVNFLLEHMKPAKLDFSKLRIPSFLELEKQEKNKGSSINESKKEIFTMPFVNTLLEKIQK